MSAATATAVGAVPADVAFPTRRDEAWKYTPVDEIVAALRAAEAPVVTVAPATLDGLAALPGGLAGSAVRLVFVNGTYAPELSDTTRLPAGVLVETAAGRAWPGPDDDGFAARNRAAGTGTASIAVAAGATVDPLLHVVHVSAPGEGEGPTVAHPRTRVDAGDGSRVAVVETYCGLPGGAVTNAATRIRVGRGATVDHLRVQAEVGDAIHVGRADVDVCEAATARVTTLAAGASIGRLELRVRLGGSDARADLAGLDLPAGRQRHDTVITVDHAASRGVSTQHFRAVVADHARGSFSGHVLVRTGTTGNDAAQSSRNLVLAPTAEADTRPWLEILADDVRCSHGASVGRLDDDAMFYLRSRGIPAGTARAMLVDAFTGAVVEGVAHPGLRAHLADVVAAR